MINLWLEEINKKWLKNPTLKTSGDYIGIDDGTNPYKESDFSKRAFQDESLRSSKKRKRKK